MNKLLLLAICFCGATATLHSQIRIGVDAGVSLSNAKVEPKDIQTLPVGGVSFDYTFHNNVSIISGLYYTMKGAKNIETISYCEDYAVFDTRLGYLELPIMLGYRFSLSEDFRIVPAIGGYLACGLNGKADFSLFTTFDPQYSSLLEWKNPFNNYVPQNKLEYPMKGFNRFNGGFKFQLSAEYKQFVFTASYDLGMKDLWNHTEEYSVSGMRNRDLMFSIGYRFSL